MLVLVKQIAPCRTRNQEEKEEEEVQFVAYINDSTKRTASNFRSTIQPAHLHHTLHSPSPTSLALPPFLPLSSPSLSSQSQIIKHGREIARAHSTARRAQRWLLEWNSKVELRGSFADWLIKFSTSEQIQTRTLWLPADSKWKTLTIGQPLAVRP